MWTEMTQMQLERALSSTDWVVPWGFPPGASSGSQCSMCMTGMGSTLCCLSCGELESLVIWQGLVDLYEADHLVKVHNQIQCYLPN